MALFSFFSKNKNEVPVRSEDYEDHEASSDIVDLRTLKKQKSHTAHTPEHKKESPHKPFSFSEKFEEKEEERGHEKSFAARASSFFSKKLRGEEPESSIVVSEETDRYRWMRSRAFMVSSGIAVFLIAVVWLLSTVFANAKVVVVAKPEDVPVVKVAVVIDPSISAPNFDAKKIPGELLQYSDDFSKTYQSTGNTFVQSKARGTLVISNKYSSATQSLVASTRFQDTKTGKIFRLTKAINVPGAKIRNGTIIASTIEADVQADQAGTEYNLAEGTFTIPGFQGTPKFSAFSATLKGSMTAGFKGQTKVITKDDLAKADADFQKEAYSSLEAKAGAKIPTGFTIIQAARKIDILSKIEPRAGDPGDSFTIQGRARLTNIAFQQQTLFQFFDHILQSTKSYKQKPLPERSTISFDSASLEKDNTLHIVSSGVLTRSAALDGASVAADLLGLSVTNAEKMLRNNDAIDTFGLKVFPFWRGSLPGDSSHISVEVLEKK